VPQSNVFDIFPQVRNAQIGLCNLNGDTWLGTVPSFTADIVSLCLLCRAVEPKTIFEIGTFNGYTAAHLALNTPGDCRIYTLDLPPDGQTSRQLSVTDGDLVKLRGERKMYSWEGTSAAGKVRPVFGDSMTFDFSPYYGKIDLFFIDGAHSYEYVRSDTLSALKCCHPGSVIAWHDFGRMGVNGVSKWLREFSGQQEVYSIPGGSLCFTPPLSPANPRLSAAALQATSNNLNREL
jgi:Methyltransferase domain